MSYVDVTEKEKVHLLLGDNIKINDNLHVQSLTTRDVLNYGIQDLRIKYTLIAHDVDDFLDMLIGEDIYFELFQKKSELNALDFHIANTLNGGYYQEVFKSMLALMLGTEESDIFIDDGVLKIFFPGSVDFIVVTPAEFDKIVFLFGLIIGEKTIESEKNKWNPADAKTREVIEKLEKAERRKNRNKSEDGVATRDAIISAVCTKSNSINRLNIKEYTFYQVLDEYSRLIKIENYQTSLDVLVHTGSDEIELEPWYL